MPIRCTQTFVAILNLSFCCVLLACNEARGRRQSDDDVGTAIDTPVDTASPGVGDTPDAGGWDDAGATDGDVTHGDATDDPDVGFDTAELVDVATELDAAGDDASGTDGDAADGTVDVETSDLNDAGDTTKQDTLDSPDVEAPPVCANAALDPGETDVDCGGPCKPCANTKFCQEHADCLSETCVFGICEKPACDDEIQNGKETGVDCGGLQCDSCPDGATCAVDGDCASAKCADEECISCYDGWRNGAETDVDCGGGDCPACNVGDTCTSGSDCASGTCEADMCCTANACGQCGALPPDTCNGLDEDCDGATDEDSTAQVAPPCPKNAGVCSGAVAVCAGGWSCGDATYLAWDDHYQPVELSCDGRDNDCDGATDEGLTNACGDCGPLPLDTCNGLDDDCDAATDEDADISQAPPCNTVGVCSAAKPVCQGESGFGCDYHSLPKWQEYETLCDGVDNDCNGSTDETAACLICAFPTTTTVLAADEFTGYASTALAAFNPVNDDLYVAATPSGSSADYNVVVARVSYGLVLEKVGLDTPTVNGVSAPTLAVGPEGVWLGAKEDLKVRLVRLNHELSEAESFLGPSTVETPVVFPDGSATRSGGSVVAPQFGALVNGAWVTSSTLQAWGPDLSFLTIDSQLVSTTTTPVWVGVKAGHKPPGGTSTAVFALWQPTTGLVTPIAEGSSGIESVVRDGLGVTHVLIRVNIGGVWTLKYLKINAAGVASSPEVVTSSVRGRLVLSGNEPRVLYKTEASNIGKATRKADGTWSLATFWDLPYSGLWWFWAGQDSAGRVHLLFQVDYDGDMLLRVFCGAL